MVDKVTPNEFRSFIVNNFRMFINNKTISGREEVAKRINKFCDEVVKKNTKAAVAFSPDLQNALMFVMDEFSANTNMMSNNIEKEMMRILEKLV
jgi:hypothetical protein